MKTVEEKISPSLGNHKPTSFTMIGLVAVEKAKNEMKNRSSWFKCRFHLHKVAEKGNICFNIFIIMSLERATQLFYQRIKI